MRPDCAWSLAELPAADGPTVMSTFACGGGSSMGYKLAGCRIVAANDIDPKMAERYCANLHPPQYFRCAIGDLVKSDDLPRSLFDLDILDGSPPCSTFSMAGSREDAWGKLKKFAEGQATQVLSDLFFDYLDLVEKLRPRVAVAENVKGMLLGNAKGYTKAVVERLRAIGYRPQVFLLNAADCGVPQRRERVFFVAIRDDIAKPPIVINPRHRWVSAGEATRDIVLTRDEIEITTASVLGLQSWQLTKRGATFSDAQKLMKGKAGWFGHCRLAGDKPASTLTTQFHTVYHWDTPRLLCFREWKRLGSFPDDYEADESTGRYMVGMSVPPRMTEAVARAICEQWL